MRAWGRFWPISANSGSHQLTYSDPFGCTARMTVEVDEINAGRDEAACPGSAPFVLSDFEPGGGVWSGPWVNDSGLFDPQIADSFEVTYSVNGCTDTKMIYVDQIDLDKRVDTVL